MTVTVIQTMCRENYAAHNGFDGNFAWKNKPGSTYIVHSTDPVEVNEVADLIDEAPNDVHYEYITDQFEADDDYKSEFLKSQIEYDGEPGVAWDTIYTDNVVKKGTKGNAWYLKRGYYAGMFNKERPEFAHLAGKFVGWVDNLNTGECVAKIVDGVKSAPDGSN